MAKKIQCDICGKLMDPDKEPILYEIHRLHQISCFSSKKDDEIKNDICSDCYNKFIKDIIISKKHKIFDENGNYSNVWHGPKENDVDDQGF